LRSIFRASIVVSFLVAALSASAFGGTVTVLDTNFDAGVPSGFSGVTTTEGVQGYAGLGTGSNVFGGSFLRNATANATAVTFTGLPPHSDISIAFLLAIIDSWDGDPCHAGPDFFNVRVDGNLLFSENFQNSNCGAQGYLPPPGVELAYRQTLGFTPTDTWYADSAYDMGLDPIFQNIPHTASTLTIEWFGSGVDYQPGADESWAIDNVVVTLTTTDADGDGVSDDQDICPGGDDNVDSDGDGVPDFCDPCPLDSANDADGDGFCADVDTCPGGDDNINSDGEGLPDFCDVCPFDAENDADADGICESDDNCPLVANGSQSDLDGDLLGDACDDDIDGDGPLNDEDNCPFDVNTDQSDLDGDGAGDVCDDDIDGDGVLDAYDACVPSPAGAVVNADGCAIADLCPCAHPDGTDRWKNHGAYTSSVAHWANAFVALGLLSETERDAIVSAAGASTCGYKVK